MLSGELRVMEESADPKAPPGRMLATSPEGVGKEWQPRRGEMAGLGFETLGDSTGCWLHCCIVTARACY